MAVYRTGVVVKVAQVAVEVAAGMSVPGWYGVCVVDRTNPRMLDGVWMRLEKDFFFFFFKGRRVKKEQVCT